MVAPNYAKTRSDLAKKLGLGRMRGKIAQRATAVVEKITAPAPKKKGRKKA
jgi:predicted transcriptional regulator